MKLPVTLLCLALSLIIAAQPSTHHANVKIQLEQYLKARNVIIPLNASIMVSKYNEVLIQKYDGMSRAETKQPINAATTFLIASATKPFTAIAIMLLQEKGKLSLADPITKWLPGVPATWKQITIKHLLSHTSGLPDFIRLKGGASLQPGLLPLLQMYKGSTLSFTPGSAFAYSNTNYMLLSYVIERSSGMKYEAFVQLQVFDQLGMKHTGFAYPKAPPTLAQAYNNVFKMDILSNEALANLAVLKGAGGIYSNSSDLVLFLNGFSKLLSQQSMDTMLQPVMSDYALGWHVQQQFGKLTIKHPGGINGFTMEMRYVPADSMAIVILSNIRFNDLNIRYTAFDMMSILNNKMPSAELTIPSAYLGKYAIPEAFQSRFKTTFLELQNQGGKFILSVAGNVTRFLIPAEKGRFFFYGEPVDVEFKNDGKLLRIISPSLGQIDCAKMQ